MIAHMKVIMKAQGLVRETISKLKFGKCEEAEVNEVRGKDRREGSESLSTKGE